MHSKKIWSLNSNFEFFKFLFLFFILQSFTSQAQTYMITPPTLQKGDTIALLATARKSVDNNLQPAIDLAHSWGLEVVIGTTIGLDNNQLAGTDEQRAADFQNQLDNPNIKAIWCVKGGYGTVRMVDLLDFTKFKQHPKWVVGFSDITVLHNHLNTMGYKSIHAVMPITVPRATPDAIESLRLSLFGEKLSYSIPSDKMNRMGTATGEIVGGNLSILYSLLGSPSAIDCKDKILFMEDLDEYLYHIDRMMMNLKRNGCLESVKGIIVGSMTKMKDNDIPWGKDAVAIIEDVTKRYNIPVIYNFPAGHIRDNRALILGSTVTMEVTNKTSTVNFE
ncbi:muramoyltetrapeptide carboxypeptidase [Flavobacterium sp. 7E]|uniref:S66 peptidase family protein n=1 Tax=Flavobacterium sp. 7E TaxID=2735898 RepID=UPI00156F626D|nr:LD-carboxypeptidase [Flavobacterium sp. 7E]NRS88727.1 muramoyltetrapeptide carboxypeptidase [Flavobacterium sp. 7E]